MSDTTSNVSISKEQLNLFKKLFVVRDDVFVEQLLHEGKLTYWKLSRSFTDRDILNHFTGNRTFGVYVTSPNNTCRFTAHDVDIPKTSSINDETQKEVKNKTLRLKVAAMNLGIRKNQIIVEFSGRRGYHVWLFFENEIPCYQAYSLAKLIRSKSSVDCEFFPKQDRIDPVTGLGSAIKLPFGIHKATSQRSVIVDEAFNPYADQDGCLSKAEPVAVKTVQEILLKNNLPLEKKESLEDRLDVSSDVVYDYDTRGGSLERLMSNCKMLKEFKDEAEKNMHIRHDKRVVISNLLAFLGEEGEKMIHNIMAACDDYDEVYTQGQIEYRKKKGYKPITCQKLKEQGLCSHDCGLKPKAGKNASPIQLCFTTYIEDGTFEIIKENQNNLILKSEDGLTFKLSNFEANKHGVWTKIEVSGKEGRIYSDALTISSGKNRKQFINKCLEHKGKEEFSSVVMEKHLMDIEQILRDKIAEEEKTSKAKKVKYEMTTEQREIAMGFLVDPDLYNVLRYDIAQLSHVGEELNKVLLYMGCVSRKLIKNPLAFVIKGPSSVGKNDLVKAVLSLMPEEEKRVVTRLTPSALYHIAKDGLAHSILCIAEKIGSEAADYSVRSLISEGNLVSLITIKNQYTGQFEAQEIVVAGPTVYIETTTQLIINYENATRQIPLDIDDTEEQTRRIHEAQRREKTLDGLTAEEMRNNIKEKHQNAQRLLRVLNVIIPYANLLIFPTVSIRTRRDNEKFLTLIMSIVILRQFQKETKFKNNIAYIEADLKDYAIAYELYMAVLSQTLDEISIKSRDLMVVINDMVSEWHNDSGRDLELHNKDTGRTLTNIVFTRADVRHYMQNRNWSDALLYACMKELGHHELLRVIQGGQGKTYKYSLLDCDQGVNQTANKLLSPEELKEKLDSQTSQ